MNNIEIKNFFKFLYVIPTVRYVKPTTIRIIEINQEMKNKVSTVILKLIVLVLIFQPSVFR